MITSRWKLAVLLAAVWPISMFSAFFVHEILHLPTYEIRHPATHDNVLGSFVYVAIMVTLTMVLYRALKPWLCKKPPPPPT
jgi:hypothetical protein